MKIGEQVRVRDGPCRDLFGCGADNRRRPVAAIRERESNAVINHLAWSAAGRKWLQRPALSGGRPGLPAGHPVLPGEIEDLETAIRHKRRRVAVAVRGNDRIHVFHGRAIQPAKRKAGLEFLTRDRAGVETGEAVAGAWPILRALLPVIIRNRGRALARASCCEGLLESSSERKSNRYRACNPSRRTSENTRRRRGSPRR